MKLTWRLWLFGIVLVLSLVAIIGGGGNAPLFVFLLGMASLFSLHFIESRGTRWFVVTLCLIGIVLAIVGAVQDGVLVTSVPKDSVFAQEGLHAGAIITSINGQPITDRASYSAAIDDLSFNTTSTLPLQRIDITTTTDEYSIFTNTTPQIIVDDIPRTNIKTGLDLRGGARAIVKPEGDISDTQLDDLVVISRNRFNVYGLSDVQIKGISDLAGNKFMLVEVAGATPTDLEELIGQQGVFEARVGNTSVFTGGKEDIADVCRNDATCAGVTECFPVQTGGYACNFRFTLYLTQAAAERHASVTSNISLDETGQYLAEKLFLYVDGVEVDALMIGADLRGTATTQISIQGSGNGATEEDALIDARHSMTRLQTVLITGSIPYKLHIEKLDTISPVLGENFGYLIVLAGTASIVLVAVIIFARYRRWKASLALLVTSFAEVLIILGFASFIGWNLDLPSIAGILATIGTGVDQQIVILDEARKNKLLSMKERLKRALFIVVSAYFTSLVSLLPLYWAGAGLFKGFAITTIIGITAGVFISRPAFAELIKRIEE